MQDGFYGLEDGLAGESVAVFLEPLDVADPDGGLGQLVGVGVDLDAVELGGRGAGDVPGGADLAGEGGDFFLQVEELFEGDVEEIGAATGGIEDLDLGDLVVECAEESV